jgi:hypothetical protein
MNDTPLGRKSKDWFARYQDNVSEWSDMFIAGLDNNVCPRQVETSVGQVHILELFNMKLSKTIDQTRMCKKSYGVPLGYFCMGLFVLLVQSFVLSKRSY